MFARPTADEERWMAAAARLGLERDRPELAGRVGGWKAVGTFTRAALFVLGVFAAGLTYAIATLMHVPAAPIVAGLLVVAVAEWLVVGRRLFGAGVEEALGVVGLLLIAFELVGGNGSGFGSSFELRLSLAMSLALLLAGMRFLNPLFTTLAVVATAFGISLGIGPVAAAASRAVIAGSFCFAAAAIALGLGATERRRPSHDQMLDWLVVVLPVCGYLWLAAGHWSAAPAAPSRYTTATGILAIVWPAVLGAATLLVGIRRRRHAPLLAAMACAACLAYELRNLTGLSLEVRLIAWGSVALALALALDRQLRTPRAGITSANVGRDQDRLGLVQLVGVAALTPPPAPAAPASFQGGGGHFDGGGASGGY